MVDDDDNDDGDVIFLKAESMKFCLLIFSDRFYIKINSMKVSSL